MHQKDEKKSNIEWVMKLFFPRIKLEMDENTNCPIFCISGLETNLRLKAKTLVESETWFLAFRTVGILTDFNLFYSFKHKNKNTKIRKVM